MLALALVLAPGLARRAGTAQQMQCARCEGLSQEACVAAINGALYGLQDDQRLALLEHVFAGDVCDELATDTCLSTLDSVLHSVSETDFRAQGHVPLHMSVTGKCFVVMHQRDLLYIHLDTP